MRAIFTIVAIGTAVSPAAAIDVNFSGTVVSTCSLLAKTDGLLGLSLDGDVLSSQGVGGLPGTVTILSIGGNDIAVGAPQLVSSPPGYEAGSGTLEVSYFGLSGLSLVSQGYTTAPTTFNAGSIAASVLTVHNRITNPDGFAAGNYSTRTTVTCVP